MENIESHPSQASLLAYLVLCQIVPWRKNSIYFLNVLIQLRINCWASLVAQWLRICLLMQGTRVRALAWEDPTCRRAAGPVSHNC